MIIKIIETCAFAEILLFIIRIGKCTFGEP